MAGKIFRGDTFRGTINLRQTDFIDPTKVNPFPIVALSVVVINFPGSSASVVLSTANAGEITIVDTDLSTITFVGAPAKSLMMALITNGSLDVIVTDPSGNVTTFEIKKAVTIVDRENP